MTFYSRLVHKVAQLEKSVTTMMSKLDVVMEKIRLQTFNTENRDMDKLATREDVSF